MRLQLYRNRWYAVWRDETGTRRVSLRTADRRAAEQSLIDLQASGQRKPEAIGEIVDAYLADKAGKPSIEGMTYAWGNLRRVFASLRPDQVNRPRCRAYAEKRRAAGASNGTIIKELGTLRAALKWHDSNTPAVVEVPSQPPPRERHLTREEFDRLLAAGKSHHIRLFIALALYTAGRASAILELEWARVDFARNQIRLSAGNEKLKGRATVPIHPLLLPMLREAERGAVTDFVIEYGGERVRSVKKAFARAAEAADLPGVSPHVLRHTAAVWMAEAGVSMEEIAQYLGHTNPSVTFRTYARFSPGHLARAAKALG